MKTEFARQANLKFNLERVEPEKLQFVGPIQRDGIAVVDQHQRLGHQHPVGGREIGAGLQLEEPWQFRLKRQARIPSDLNMTASSRQQKIRRIQENFGEKHVVRPVARGLTGVERREIGRVGGTNNVGIVRRVEGNAVTGILTAAAKISGVKKGGGISVESDDKNVVAAGIGRAEKTGSVGNV